MEQKRQGDVLLVAVDVSPDEILANGNEIQRVNGRLIIKAGEQTGHHHAIVSPDVKMIEMADIRYIIAIRAFDVFHEEHSIAHFEPQVYEIPEQVEYTPAEIRRVID